MNRLQTKDWAKICLFNLTLVAALGVLMRYKIGFYFPFFNQKNLQHAHSHFAFAGWISQILMVLMVGTLKDRLSTTQNHVLDKILWANLLCAFGMLFSFPFQGYGAVSITFSTASILVAFAFSHYYTTYSSPIKGLANTNWFRFALLCNVISSIGTFYLSYMMATKNIGQHSYLASIYWYLHFQYNGWFFFACAGLLIDYLQRNGFIISNLKNIFWLLAISCLPAYGLSVLWLDLSNLLYIVVILSAVVQVVAWIWFLWMVLRFPLQPSTTERFLWLFVGVALSIKFALQIAITFPTLAQLVFGFRTVVIAYLHLVLLAFTTVFLLNYLYSNHLLPKNKISNYGLFAFVAGVFLNELVLAIQGFASFSYTLIPFVNEILFGIAVLMGVGLGLMNIGSNKEVRF